MAMQFRGIVTSILSVAATVLSSSATIDSAVADDLHSAATTAAVSSTTKVVEPELSMGCWGAIFKVPSCVGDIAKVVMGDVGAIFGIGKPCCKAFLSLTDDCKIKVFQNLKFLPVIESFCAAITGGGSPPRSG
ncbi:unnamed protein product [Linum tenue]|uniref:Prolamin-like domain-containing protein n=1 Tax=Linum tenue TaxID=586396 RepID=A0AAV0N1F2_9ROSI|nr:unnamed protein product [Linum tenue]